jgi:hypothetical membrane protein
MVPDVLPAPGAAPPAARDLLTSLAILTGIVLFALAGLATDRNWAKIERVGFSFLTYAGILLTLMGVRAHVIQRDGAVPLRWFIAAGAAAGIVSGLVRPEFRFSVLVAGTVAAATLIASAHWLGLRQWRALRGSIEP